ncbi:MAG TPA: hypothetical protein PL063_02040 [Candidatus Cloacimonadota bacterium]|nr:hypothetical protein [Candidatus Cloacimonadota bacterium]HQB40434.1 hypothetical protein [Candidatus Cloacimonadota bacterium]
MKRFLLSITLLSILFLFVACDRFDQDYLVVIKVEDFISTFTSTTQNALISHDTNSIMAFYADNYMNNGIDKDESRAFYNQEWSNNVQFEVTLLDESSLKYSIHIFDEDLNVDTQWEDYAKKIGNTYYWYGDQENPNIQPQAKQVALVEVLTALWCSNCPDVEHALDAIYANIPQQMIMLNYHVGDQLTLSDLNSTPYYGITAPTVLFQGTTQISGAGQTQIDQYQTVINNIISSDADISFDNISFNKESNKVTGSVKINTHSNMSFENTYLRLAIYEKETDKAHLITHELAKNVVRARAMVDLSDKDINNSIDFTINFTNTLDDDTYLVIWVQKNVSFDAINPETDRVYNAIEMPLNTRR